MSQEDAQVRADRAVKAAWPEPILLPLHHGHDLATILADLQQAIVSSLGIPAELLKGDPHQSGFAEQQAACFLRRLRPYQAR